MQAISGSKEIVQTLLRQHTYSIPSTQWVDSAMRVKALICQALVVAAAVLVASCGPFDTSGPGLCNLMGPCQTPVQAKIDYHFAVGYPDSLVSKDPTNVIGVLNAGDAVVLRWVHMTELPAGQTLGEHACTLATDPDPALHWAVSDSSTASVVAFTGGTAVVSAKAAGRFEVLNVSAQPASTATAFWFQSLVACPSGRMLGPTVVNGAG